MTKIHKIPVANESDPPINEDRVLNGIHALAGLNDLMSALADSNADLHTVKTDDLGCLISCILREMPRKDAITARDYGSI